MTTQNARIASLSPVPFTATFTLERETKNTYRYQESGKAPKIGALYVQKLALGEDPPQSLTVTVTAS